MRRPAPVSRATYWRRRAVVLAVGIGLLSAFGWTVDGVLTASSSAGQASPSSGPGTDPSIVAQVHKHHASPARTPSPEPSPARSRHRHTRHASAPPSGKAVACAAGAVTLRISSPQYWYQSGKTPRFTVRAVSAASQPCRFNMGSKFVSVVVTTNDRPIWTSADCPRGSGSDVTVLTPGRPGVLHVSWDRSTSSPDCGATRRVRPGPYQVTAVASHLRSSTMNVVLGASGASGP